MGVVLGIRHAEVDNPNHLVYGRSQGFPLTAAGLAAALALGDALRAADVVAVCSSPLERARQTAEALAAPHGLEVAEDDRLIEWGGLGPWVGRPWAEAMVDPALLAMYADPVGRCPGDPLDRVGARVLEWAVEAGVAHPDGVVLGVSHEAPLVAAYLAGRGADWSAFRAVNVPHLGGVRLIPGPPEITDPAALVPAC